MDYNALVSDKTTPGSIKFAINWDRIDSVGIVAEAEAYIYAKLRVPEMKATTPLSLPTGASSIAYPSDYRDPIQLGIPGYIGRITLREPEWFRTYLGFDETATLPTGLPGFWTDIDNQIQLNTIADIDYTAVLTYFKTPQALSAGNPTNFLTSKYPTLMRRCCLMFAAEYRKESDTYNNEEARVLAQLDEIKVESDLRMRGIEMDMNWESTAGTDDWA